MLSREKGLRIGGAYHSANEPNESCEKEIECDKKTKESSNVGDFVSLSCSSDEIFAGHLVGYSIDAAYASLSIRTSV